MTAARASLVVLGLLGAPVIAQERVATPPGAQVLQQQCLGCHGMDLIEQQRLSKIGWEREVDKMVRWGARVDAAERTALVEHLVQRFGVGPVASHEPVGMAAAGEATLQRACLSCHGMDLIEQQRLTTTGWTREVEKMVRWGAVVPESDRAALVALLTARYGQ